MEKKKIVLAGGVVTRVIKGKVCIALFRYEPDQTWLLPKGYVQEGETLEQAALRRVAEELGLTEVQIVKSLGIKEQESLDGKEREIIHYFLMKAKKGDFQTGSSISDALNLVKGGEAGWFPLDELPDFFQPEQRELILEQFHQILLEFEEVGSPAYKIDYRRLKTAAVVTVFVRQARTKKILLLQRSDQVGTYAGLWNTVAGYLDDEKSPEEKARIELHEELNLDPTRFRFIKEGPVFEFKDPVLNRSWIVHPLLFETDQEEVTLNWEHVAYQWANQEELMKYPMTPQLDESLGRVL